MHYEYPTYGQKYVSTNYYYPSEKGDGTLGSMMAALTGAKDTDTPGLLSSEQLTNQGGNIVLTFDLTKDSDGTKIGELTMNLKVSGDPNETEASVLEKINAALNVDPNTQKDVIIDFKTSSTNLQTTYNVVNKSTEKTSTVAENVYEDDLAYTYIDLNIHGGPSSKDQMLHKYQCLRLGAIDMEESNVLTEEACMETLDTVGAAIQKISRERSQFGAFQNRLEHARDIDKNTAENTTAAESRIRDTDMAEQMVEHSKHNILMNAGQAMLAQANSSTQGVVNLIK